MVDKLLTQGSQEDLVVLQEDTLQVLLMQHGLQQEQDKADLVNT
jgi:hypothetical protein